MCLLLRGNANLTLRWILRITKYNKRLVAAFSGATQPDWQPARSHGLRAGRSRLFASRRIWLIPPCVRCPSAAPADAVLRHPCSSANPRCETERVDQRQRGIDIGGRRAEGLADDDIIRRCADATEDVLGARSLTDGQGKDDGGCRRLASLAGASRGDAASRRRHGDEADERTIPTFESILDHAQPILMNIRSTHAPLIHHRQTERGSHEHCRQLPTMVIRFVSSYLRMVAVSMLWLSDDHTRRRKAV
jgi:hypothetical protein